MTRDEYIYRLRHLEPLNQKDLAAFTSQTQRHTNGAPPPPLPLGYHGVNMYALKSQCCIRTLQDAKVIDFRNDFTYRQSLIGFKSARSSTSFVGPQVGTCLGSLLVRLKSGPPAGLESIDSWKNTGYHVVLSVVSGDVWLIYCSCLEEGCVGFPRELGMSLRGKEGRQDGLKVFNSAEEMTHALEMEQKEELFKMKAVEDVLDGEVTWWVVRDEDLKKEWISGNNKEAPPVSKTKETVSIEGNLVKLEKGDPKGGAQHRGWRDWFHR